MAENTRGLNLEGQRGSERRRAFDGDPQRNAPGEQQMSRSRNMNDEDVRSSSSNRSTRWSSIFTRRNFISTDYHGHLSDE